MRRQAERERALLFVPRFTRFCLRSRVEIFVPPIMGARNLHELIHACLVFNDDFFSGISALAWCSGGGWLIGGFVCARGRSKLTHKLISCVFLLFIHDFLAVIIMRLFRVRAPRLVDERVRLLTLGFVVCEAFVPEEEGATRDSDSDWSAVCL